jgi:general secretion pathway protein I
VTSPLRVRSFGARAAAGFSLLEMMVAMTILSISLGVMYQAVSGATRNVRADERYAFGVELARSLLADNSKVPRAGVSKRGETAGGYRWTVISSPISSPMKRMKDGTLQDIEVTVAWNDGDRVREFKLGSVVEGIGK